MTPLWSLDKPADNDPLTEITSMVSGQKLTFEDRIEHHFDWSDSTISAGLVSRSSTTPGSARMFFGPRSEVSQPTKDGIGMIVSDESRLIWFNSEQSSYVGGQGAMLMISPAIAGATANDGSRWVADHGRQNLTAGIGETRIDFNITYATPPVTVQVTHIGNLSTPNSGASVVLSVGTIGTSNFSLKQEYLGPGADVGGRVHWRSLGTVAL